MAVRIKPQATTEARFPDKLVSWRTPNEVDEPAVGIVLLLQDLRERQVPLLLRHLGVESIDAALNTSHALSSRLRSCDLSIAVCPSTTTTTPNR